MTRDANVIEKMVLVEIASGQGERHEQHCYDQPRDVHTFDSAIVRIIPISLH